LSQVYSRLVDILYGYDVWENFTPDAVEQNLQGWNGTHPSLKRLPAEFEQQIIVDIGVWKGQSTITLASNLQEKNIDGVVIAVDTFLGSPEHWNADKKLFKRINGLPDLYRTFLSNVASRGLTNYVIPLPQTSSTACKILRSKKIAPTLIHVDAAHEYREAINDISDYWDILSPGGVMVGDDYHESWPGIVRAAGEFSAKIGRALSIEGPKFILRKPAPPKP
jgi:predicted O-methyltransferase YrrM